LAKSREFHLIIQMVLTSLYEISSPRFFNTERGFQGRFLISFNKQLEERKIFPEGTIIEEEYQKSNKLHGIKQRPDLLVHIPIESSTSSNRKENNFIAFEFKLNGNKVKVLKDFDKLDEMIIKLHYNYGIFININSLNSFLADYEGTNKDKLQEFCIKQLDGKLKLRYAYFIEGKIIISDI